MASWFIAYVAVGMIPGVFAFLKAIERRRGQDEPPECPHKTPHVCMSCLALDLEWNAGNPGIQALGAILSWPVKVVPWIVRGSVVLWKRLDPLQGTDPRNRKKPRN